MPAEAISGANPFPGAAASAAPANNITSETDTRNGASAETQCFSYDTLSRLTTAWTATDSCAASPSTGAGGNVGDGITGSAYWTSWTYNPLGDQQTQTQHSVTGGTSTITTYTYNDGNATTSGQPDTLTSSATTGPGAATATYTYDADGNTTARNLSSGNQTLTWYPNGKLKTDTTSSGTTTYVYDADGNLLLQEDPGETTLYVFGEQLTLNTGTGAVTGTRFLSLPGGGTAVRTGSGTNYSYEIADQHGTSLLTLDNTLQHPQWRQYTPFGAPRGTPPASWPDTNGYLGDPTGSNSNLTSIGAREYDPATGRFISIDPVFEQNSPQQYNGYSYAADNPITNDDPSGLFLPAEGGTCEYYEAGCITATSSNPPLSLSQVGEGVLNFFYHQAVVAALIPLGIPELAPVADKYLPAGFTNNHPDNPSMALGEGIGAAASFLIPADDAGTATAIITEAASDGTKAGSVGDEGLTLFRGTSEGFQGSPALQRAQVSPASSDPLVGTIFATHGQQFGRGVLQIASPGDLSGVDIGPGSFFKELEKEYTVGITPAEFAARASTTISASTARSILGGMGYSVPGMITRESFQTVLDNSGRLSPDEIDEFLLKARS